jgi:hypothetical protein
MLYCAWVNSFILFTRKHATAPRSWRSKNLKTKPLTVYYQHESPQTDKTRARRLRKLLIARSRLRSNATFSPLPTPPPPEQGHASFRMTMGLGYDDGQHYQRLRLRPAYHDLLEPEAGYTPGAQINFFDLSMRHHSSNLKLDALKLIDIVLLSPRDRFFQSLSWKINTGWQRRQLDEDKRALIYRTNGGAGFSYKPVANMQGYAFLESSLDIGGALRHDYALGLGGSAGLFIDVGSRWRGHIYANVQRFGLGHTQTLHDVGIEQRLTLSQNNALRLRLNRHSFNQNNGDSQIEFSWQWYFW